MSFRGILLAGCVFVAGTTPSLAADRKADPRLDALERQLRDVQKELAGIRARQDDRAPLEAARRDSAARADAIEKRLAAQPRTSVNNGRFTITSADGDYSLSLRALVQFDMGYFMEGRNPPGVDLNSGTNFRRAQVGFTGNLGRDWSYNLALNFGGSGVERSGYLHRAYIQYDGLAPFAIRLGATAPFAGLDDATSASEIQFLERSTAASVARGIAASPGRSALNLFVAEKTYFLSAAISGMKTTETASFDEQLAFVGRGAWLALDRDSTKWLLDANLTHVFQLADAAAGPNPPNSFRLSSPPELVVDGSRIIDTGAIDARSVTEFGFETALQLDRFYSQGGWFRYDIARRTTLPSPHFSGWYAQASWSLTGEPRRYDSGTASFRGPKPDQPLGKGFGAWEIKARYSNTDLDYMPLAATGAVTGGVQNTWTLGLNWYPNETIRFMLEYDNIQVNHINAPGTDISASAIGLRSQLAL